MQFVVALEPSLRTGWSRELAAEPYNPVRRYAETVVRVRLHQRPFRDRVLLAYGSQCALCRLRHVRPLDAAHIKEDSDGGEPVVPNGVAVCVIHHRAFDAEVSASRQPIQWRCDRTSCANTTAPRFSMPSRGCTAS